MRTKETSITQTTQIRSWVSLSEPDKDLSVHEDETEDNMSLLLQIFDSLNRLHESLNRLDCAIERKAIELKLHGEGRG